jgi:hypothetical protein
VREGPSRPQQKQYELTFRQRIALRLRGYCFLRWEKRPGWRDYLPIYLVRCPDCKRLFEDYPHGYSGYFDCPYCREQRRGGS